MFIKKLCKNYPTVLTIIIIFVCVWHAISKRIVSLSKSQFVVIREFTCTKPINGYDSKSDGSCGNFYRVYL